MNVSKVSCVSCSTDVVHSPFSKKFFSLIFLFIIIAAHACGAFFFDLFFFSLEILIIEFGESIVGTNGTVSTVCAKKLTSVRTADVVGHMLGCVKCHRHRSPPPLSCVSSESHARARSSNRNVVQSYIYLVFRRYFPM